MRAVQAITNIDRSRREPAAPAVEASFTRITERAAIAAVEAFFASDERRPNDEQQLPDGARPGYVPRASSQRSHVVR